MNRALIVLGASVLILGLGWSWFRQLPLFRLPGDIVIERPGIRFFFPITTMLLISATRNQAPQSHQPTFRTPMMASRRGRPVDCTGR